MVKKLDYASSGVDRKVREKAKQVFASFKDTYHLSRFGKIRETPFNILYPLGFGTGFYQVKTADGVGTKVLLAELANKHDTIGLDAVAMVVNDCIRCGAAPLALTDIIDVKKSTPELLNEIQKGLNAGAVEANCPLVGGETADVPELMSSLYHVNMDCVGVVAQDEVIDGSKIKPGDVVIGLRSSGVHSNGISLVRRALFKKWGGKYKGDETVESTGRSVLHEALVPTRIYVKPFLKLIKRVKVLGAVHITGDAYLKFEKLTKHGFHFNNFKPHQIFKMVQEAGKVSTKEMFKTFNQGWGFAVIVRRKDADAALQSLGEEAEVIGEVVERGISIEYAGKRFSLK
jgi:phosphoribosylformylglycinamidine cyclo-ligase